MNHSNLSVQPSSASNMAGPRRLENVIDWPKVSRTALGVLGAGRPGQLGRAVFPLPQ